MRYQKQVKTFLSTLLLIAIVVVVIVFSKSQASTENYLKVYFLNVGQGDSSYIKTPTGEDILIDGGPDNSVLNELGKVMNFGDREINLMILSHPHADHLTGLLEVLNRFKVDEIWETGVEYPSATYGSWRNQILVKKINDKFVKAGDTKNFGNVKISILYPLSPINNQKIDNINNASIINRLNFDSFSVLYTGDGEKEVQQKLASNTPANELFSDILKVAHHGSSNGLYEEFIKIVRPAVAIISVGKDNKFGHPAPNTLNLLKKYSVRVFRTDQDGTIEIDSSGDSFSIK